MRARLALPIAMLCLLAPAASQAQNASLELSGATLNRVVKKIGVLSDGGVAATYNRVVAPGRFEMCVFVGYMGCGGKPGQVPGFEGTGIPLGVCRETGGGVAIVPGEPVRWEWWITDARIDIASGGMTFTASVTTHVGEAWQTVTKSAPAAVRFDPLDNRMKMDVGEFKVSLGAAGTLDVAKLYRIAIPISPQAIAVAMPDGSTKTVTGRVASASVEYQPDKIKVNFDVAF